MSLLYLHRIASNFVPFSCIVDVDAIVFILACPPHSRTLVRECVRPTVHLLHERSFVNDAHGLPQPSFTNARSQVCPRPHFPCTLLTSSSIPIMHRLHFLRTFF